MTAALVPPSAPPGRSLHGPPDAEAARALPGSRSRQNDDVRIRPWQPEDTARLEELGKTLSPDTLAARFLTGVPCLPGTYVRMAEERWPARWNAVVALRGDAMTGWADYGLHGEDPGRADIGVCVADAEQGRGLGTRLLREVIALCAANGVTALHADVGRENHAARRLSRKLPLSRITELRAAERQMTFTLHEEPGGFRLSSPAPSAGTRQRRRTR